MEARLAPPLPQPQPQPQPQPLRIALATVSWFNLASALIGFVGLTFFGGMGLPQRWLEGTVFSSYVWPGVILGCIVGGSQVLALAGQYRRLRLAWGVHAAAGLVMVVWVFVEIALVLVWSPLQGLYFATGLVQTVLAVLALGAWPRPFLVRARRASEPGADRGELRAEQGRGVSVRGVSARGSSARGFSARGFSARGSSARGFSVRRAGVADAATVGRLLFDFNAEFETPTPSAAEFAERFRSLFADDDIVAFIAEGDVRDRTTGEATGFALLSLRPTPYFDGPLVQLEELYVVPALRDQGIGTALLEAVVSYARARASREIHIGVDEIDTDTRRFYERHGFVNVQPGEDYRMLMYLRELGEAGESANR